MKKLSVKSLTDKLLPVAAMSVGFAAAKAVPALVSQVYKPTGGLSNTIIGVSEIAAGILLSSMKNKHLANVGLGVAISGVHTFLADPIDSALVKAGLIKDPKIHGSAWSAGYNYNANNSQMGCSTPEKILN